MKTISLVAILAGLYGILSSVGAFMLTQLLIFPFWLMLMLGSEALFFIFFLLPVVFISRMKTVRILLIFSSYKISLGCGIVLVFINFELMSNFFSFRFQFCE